MEAVAVALIGLALFVGLLFLLIRLCDKLKRYFRRNEYDDEWMEFDEEAGQCRNRVPQPRGQETTPGAPCLRWTHNIYYPRLISGAFHHYVIPAGSSCYPTPAATTSPTPEDSTHVSTAPESPSASSAPPPYTFCSKVHSPSSLSLPLHPISPSSPAQPLHPTSPAQTPTHPRTPYSPSSTSPNGSTMTPQRSYRLLLRPPSPSQASPVLERLRQGVDTVDRTFIPEDEVPRSTPMTCVGCEEGRKRLQNLVEEMEARGGMPVSPRETLVPILEEAATEGKTAR